MLSLPFCHYWEGGRWWQGLVTRLAFFLICLIVCLEQALEEKMHAGMIIKGGAVEQYL